MMMIYENWKSAILIILASLISKIATRTCSTTSDCQSLAFLNQFDRLVFENVFSNEYKKSVGTPYCSSGLCVSCIHNSHCKENSQCIQNKCTCLFDSDCQNDSICNFGFCQARPDGCNFFSKSPQGLYCTSCSPGYNLIESHCIPTCGDGIRIFEHEFCDDGNLENGDGCSSTCQIEEGWLCRRDTIEKPDTCYRRNFDERILANQTEQKGFQREFDAYSITILGAIGLCSFPLILSGDEPGSFLRVYGNLQSLLVMRFFNVEIGKEFRLMTSLGEILFWNYIPNPFDWVGISFTDLTDPNISPKYSDIGITKIFLRDCSQIFLLLAGAIAIEILLKILLVCFKKNRLLLSLKRVLGFSFVSRFLLLNPLVTLVPAFLQIFSISSKGWLATISIVASVCVFCIYLGIMLFLFLKQQKIFSSNSDEEELESQKTSIFFESINHFDKLGVMSFYFWQVLKAILISLIITVLENRPRFQTGAHSLISIIYLLIMLKSRPYRNSKENTRQIGLETGVSIISVLYFASTFFDENEIVDAINGALYVVIIGYFAFSFYLTLTTLISRAAAQKRKKTQVQTIKTSETTLEINRLNMDNSELDITKVPTKSHKASQEMITIEEKPKIDLSHVLNSIDLKRELSKLELADQLPRDIKRYKQPDPVLRKRFGSQSSIEAVSPSVSDIQNSIDEILETKEYTNGKPITPITIQTDKSYSEAALVLPVEQKATHTESEISLETLDAKNLDSKNLFKKKSRPLGDITKSMSGANNLILVQDVVDPEVKNMQMSYDNVLQPRLISDFQEENLEVNPRTQDSRDETSQLSSSPKKKFNFQLDFSKLHRNADRERIHKKLLEAIIPMKNCMSEIEKMDIL